MAKVCDQNVNVNFNYCTEAVILFLSWIIVIKQNCFQKILFKNLENDLKCFIILIMINKSKIQMTGVLIFVNFQSSFQQYNIIMYVCI